MVAKRWAAAALALLLTAEACGVDISGVGEASWPSYPDEPATTAASPDGRDVRRTPTVEYPLRVTSIGDSVAFDADPGIRAALESTGRVIVMNSDGQLVNDRTIDLPNERVPSLKTTSGFIKQVVDVSECLQKVLS